MATQQTIEAVGDVPSPGLVPAQAQQVSQFLLARNYYLTALEFLVESIEHGCESEVTSLQEFFNDSEKFPASELSKYQNSNALDLQARAKEREETLQLLEYELRVSKEDVQELKSQLQQTQQALAVQLEDRKVQEHGCSPQDDTNNGTTVQGLPQHFPPSTALGTSHILLEPTNAQLQELNAAVAAHLLSQGYRVTALSLQEEAGVSVSWDATVGNPVWDWYCKAHSTAAPFALKSSSQPLLTPAAGLDTASSSESVPSPTSSSPSSFAEEEQLRQQLQAAQAQMREMQDRLKVYEEAAALAEVAAVQDQGLHGDGSQVKESAVEETGSGEGVVRQLPSPRAAASVDDSDGSDEDGEQDSAGFLENGQLRRKPSRTRPLHLPPSLGDSEVAVSAGVDMMRLVTDLMPKISSNLTIKSRQELLPLLQVVVTHHPSLGARKTHLSLLFNLVPSPDSAQRDSIIQSCVELAKELGPEWTAAELLPLCCKAVSNQSAERRAMCIELCSALLPLVDLCSQFDIVMSILKHLCDDRISGVRESVVATAARLLESLPFLRHCYSPVEELLFECMKDTEEVVAAKVLGVFVPELLHWLQPTDLVATQLLPRTLSTLHCLLRSPPTSQKPTHKRRSTHGSMDFAIDEEVMLLNAGKPPPLEGHYSQARQLIRLFQLQLPQLADTALRTAPQWALLAGSQLDSVSLTDAHTQPDILQDPLQHGPSQDARNRLGPLASKPASQVDSLVHLVLPPVLGPSQLANQGPAASPTRTPKAATPQTTMAPTAPAAAFIAPPSTTTSAPTAGDSTTTDLNASATLGGVAPVGDAAGVHESVGTSTAAFASWLSVGEQWRMWRVLSWCMQSMVPQLVLVMQTMGAGHDIMALRLELAAALKDTCRLLGPPLTRQAIVPMLAVAAAATSEPPIPGPHPPHSTSAPRSIIWSSIPRHVQELASQLAPATDDEMLDARQRVLPFLLGVVLPQAGPGSLQSFVQHLMEAEGEQQRSCWALRHKGDVRGALRFAAGIPEARPELLELLSQLVHGNSLCQRLCGITLAQALAPCVPAPVLSQSVLPALMTLLGAGDREVKSASIEALGDVSRQLSITPPDGDTQLAASCQQKIHAIFDHLLQDGGHELQLCVLRTLSKVTTLDERLAGNGMLAQLEYLMQKLQFLLVQMQVGLSQQRSPEELRELASLLLNILQATFTCEGKDPKTQAYMSAALQSMHTQRGLLDEAQQESLAVMAQAQGSVAAPAYTTAQGPSNSIAAAAVPPLPSTGMASQRPHDPLNAPEVLKSVAGAVVGSKLVNRWRGSWRGNKAATAETAAKTVPQGPDQFFDE